MEKKDYKVELLFDDSKVGLNRYVESVFYNVIMGMVNTLKRTGDPEKIVLNITKKQ